MNLPSNLVGILNGSHFNVTTIEIDPNSVLPDIIQVEASLLNTYLNITLHKLKGLWQTSSMNSKVYIFDDASSSAQLLSLANLVRI